MKFIKILRTFILFTLLATMIYSGFKTYQSAKLYENYTTQIATACDAHGLANERIDEFTSIISLGLLPNKSRATLEKLKKSQTFTKSLSQNYFYTFLISLISLILLSLTCSQRGAALTLSFATFISLIYGLINPILMVTIHKPVEYLGDVILSFESKGIIGSITKLYNNDEVAIALTILVFSILLPILKSITLTFTLLFYEQKWSHKLVTFFKQIGKWSMIDVFVVATFLVYLTSNSGGISKAEIQVGLYFFLIYVILSMITAILTQRFLRKNL